ncbi:MAG: M13 family metallopeptidase [Bryobacteraceae bacterium]
MRRLASLSALSFLVVSSIPAQEPKKLSFDPASLNRSVDPCEDFFQYACGGWMTANPLPADQSRWGRFDALQDNNRIVLREILEAAAKASNRSAIDQKIGDYYATCMDEGAINARGTAPLRGDLDAISAVKNKADITKAVARLFRSGTTPFFRFGAGPDSKNSSLNIADLDQGGLGLPDRDYYLKTGEKDIDLRNKYVAHVQKMFELIGVAPAEAAKKAQAVLAIETKLAQGSLDRVSRRDPEKMYNIRKLKDLSEVAPSFGWEAFFKSVGTPKFQTLNVDVPDYLKSIETVIKDSTLDDLKSYLTWHAVHGASSVLPATFEQEAFNFYGKTLSGAKELRPRWKRCVDQTDNQLPDALGRTFVEKTLGQEGIRRTGEMVAEIEKAFAADVQSLDWMTPATKDQALTKLHGILNKIGTNEKWQDYAKVKIVKGDAYGNAERTSIHEVSRQLARINKPVDKKEWEMSQPTVNAYYEPSQNDINFPAGILQPPFYDNKIDDPVNYGAIGAVIGHELTHGFDDQGRQFDAKGNLRDWWTAEDAKAFEQRASCLVDQYSGYSPVPDVKLNGKLTLGENTADNGGLRIAYMALLSKLAGKEPEKRDGFTAQQRFFLGFAQVWCETRTPEMDRMRAQTDPHSPGRFRVNGTVSNMPEFQQAFACGAGKSMTKGPACRVW